VCVSFGEPRNYVTGLDGERLHASACMFYSKKHCAPSAYMSMSGEAACAAAVRLMAIAQAEQRIGPFDV